MSGGVPFAVTCERVYDESNFKPKIPVGVHICTRTRFNRGGYDTFEVNVLGHSRLLFHKGNTANDSDGCVLIGEQFGLLSGAPAILQSGAGFEEFMRLTADVETFDLSVFE